MLYLITRNDRVVVAVGYMYPFYVVRTLVGKRKFRALQVPLPEHDCIVFGLRFGADAVPRSLPRIPVTAIITGNGSRCVLTFAFKNQS